MTKSMKIFVIVSVLLNLLLVGVIVGEQGKHYFGPSLFPGFQEEVARALPADKFAIYQKTMRGLAEENRLRHEELGEARKQALDLIKADKFDRQAYLAQMKHMQELRAQMMIHMAETVASLAEQMNSQERAILADSLRKPGPHGPQRAKPGDDK